MDSFSDSLEPLFVMKSSASSVHCLLFHHFQGKDYLCVGTLDGTIQIWDLEINRKTRTIKPTDNTCLSLHIVDNCLITQDKSGVIQIWKFMETDFTCIYSRNFSNFSFCKISVLFLEDIFVAVPQPNSKVNFYRIIGNNLEFDSSSKCTELDGKKLGDVSVLKVTTFSSVSVIIIYESGIMAIWSYSEKSIVYHEQITNDTPMCVEFDSENLQGVCGTSGDNMVAFKFDNNFKMAKKKSISITNPGIGSLCVRSDRKILAAGCWDGQIRIFSWKSLKLLAVLNYHLESVLDVRFSSKEIHNKFLLAGGSSDSFISLWDLYN